MMELKPPAPLRLRPGAPPDWNYSPAITSNNGGYFVQAHCRGQPESDWNGRVLKRWRLFNSGRRLEIRDAKALP
jgi:hypothetical protein